MAESTMDWARSYPLEKREEGQVKKEIEEIAGLVRNGADFAELATLFSQAPTAEHGGDLGLVRVQDLSEDIRNAAATLEPGQVSQAIRSKYGFHVLKLIERKPVVYKTQEDAKPEITRLIQESRYDEKLKTYLEELHTKAYIETVAACNANVR